MTNIKTTIAQLGLILTVIGAAMFISDVGLGETYNVVMGENTKATTDAVFNHCTVDSQTGIEICTGADFTDRLVVTAMTLGLLVGLGAVGVNRNNPQVINQMIRYMPLVGAAIGVSQFADEIADIVTGDHVYSASSDAYNGMLLCITGWVAAFAARFFKN